MKYYHPTLFILLLCLTFAWLYLYWYRRNYGNVSEGFQQDRAFSSKNGGDIYDSFYTEIYDELMLSHRRAQELFDAIVHVSQPTLRYSMFLDVGCGTGAMLERLDSAGYKAVGIDRSADMVGFCQQKLIDSRASANHVVGVNSEVIHGDVLDSMQFDRARFSHIICDGMTLYEWTDSEKLRFFRNCYFWTIAGGYLFVHLVDPSRFSPIAVAALESSNLRSRTQVTDTDIDFLDFTYRSVYSADKGTDKGTGGGGGGGHSEKKGEGCGCATRRETFTDFKTQHVRENELELHMSSVDSVVSLASRSGFVVKAKWNLLDSPYSDAHQFIYMFERTL